MKIDGDPPVQLTTGSIVVSFSNDLSALAVGEHHWDFGPTKHRKKGPTAHRVTREVADACGVRVGRIAEARRPLRIKFRGSGLEAIKRAWAAERKKTGQAYVIRFRDGLLEVVPLQRPKIVYEVKGMITDGENETIGPKKPHTVIVARGRINGRKEKARVVSHDALERLGLSILEKSYGKVDSRQDLVDQATRDLADSLRSKRTVQLEIPGVPFIERGSIVHWFTDEPGWSGPGKGTHDRGFAYVTAVTHSGEPGTFRSSLTLSQFDPYLADQRARDKERREGKKPARDRARRS
jgi:hypothetical protein